MKELSYNELSQVFGGNAAGNAVLGAYGGFEFGFKFCKIPNPIGAGVCIGATTVAGGYLGYKAN